MLSGSVLEKWDTIKNMKSLGIDASVTDSEGNTIKDYILKYGTNRDRDLGAFFSAGIIGLTKQEIEKIYSTETVNFKTISYTNCDFEKVIDELCQTVLSEEKIADYNNKVRFSDESMVYKFPIDYCISKPFHKFNTSKQKSINAGRNAKYVYDYFVNGKLDKLNFKKMIEFAPEDLNFYKLSKNEKYLLLRCARESDNICQFLYEKGFDFDEAIMKSLICGRDKFIPYVDDVNLLDPIYMFDGCLENLIRKGYKIENTLELKSHYIANHHSSDLVTLFCYGLANLTTDDLKGINNWGVRYHENSWFEYLNETKEQSVSHQNIQDKKAQAEQQVDEVFNKVAEEMGIEL